jgi:hypothetical protein
MQFNPNLDPHIHPFDALKESPEGVVVRSGCEALLRKEFDHPMPAILSFDSDSIDKMRAFECDDQWNARWFF